MANRLDDPECNVRLLAQVIPVSLEAVSWSNLFAVAARPFDEQAVHVDTVTNRQRFYLLLPSQ
jgi:hypothetical protein